MTDMPNMDERLARIETLLDHLISKLDQHERETVKRAEKVERAVYGDGNGYRGLNIRVDRLEQDTERRTWREKAAAGVVIMLVVKAAFDLLQSGAH